MAGSIPFRLSSAVLEWARVSMGYTIDEAAKKAGVPLDQFLAWERGEKSPTYKQLETLAYSVFKRPLAILLLPTPPAEDSIKQDFRNLSNSEINLLSSQVRLALRKAKRYQSILEEIGDSNDSAKFKEFKVSIKDDPYTAANRFRKFIGLNLDGQKSWKYSESFYNFKALLESIGIYIFQFKMPLQEARAFCLTGDFPIIALSTEDSDNGRIFSLFHEVCHIYFNFNGLFRDTLSGTLTESYAEIERFCNEFAASFLVPDKDFQKHIGYPEYKQSTWNEFEILELAKLYSVSREVIARKLLSLELISEADLWKRKRMWDAQAKSAKEAEREKRKEKEAKGIAQENLVISEKGKSYISQVIRAYNSGAISISDVSNYLETKLDHLPKILQRLNP